MTRKNSPFLGTIICAGCKDTVPQRSSTHKYCTTKCRDIYYTVTKETFTKNCEVCNEVFSTHRPSTSSCSKFCAAIISAVRRQLYSDEELVHLMLLNKGYGYQRFCEEITSTRQRSLSRIDYLVESTLEDTGLNLFNLLNDPAGLIVMPLDEWVAAGKPTVATKHFGGSGNKMRRKEYMAKHELAMEDEDSIDRRNRRTSRKVKVYPEFNWGPYTKRQR